MTCEVAVMNKRGVALAADSAVTVGNGFKVYHTAEKLFQLRGKPSSRCIHRSSPSGVSIGSSNMDRIYCALSRDRKRYFRILCSTGRFGRLLAPIGRRFS
jgi:hypothetical protein